MSLRKQTPKGKPLRPPTALLNSMRSTRYPLLWSAPTISTYTTLVRSISSAIRRRRDPDPFQFSYHLTYLTRSSKSSVHQAHFYLLLHAFRHRSLFASTSLRP